MINYRKPTVYEVIFEDHPVSLYLDIDLSLDEHESTISYGEADALIAYIKMKLIEHLNLSFPGSQEEFDHEHNLIIMHSCSNMKFSLHIVHRGIVFDNNSCSCASYVLEFDAYIKMDILTGTRRTADGDENNTTNILLAKNRLRIHLSFIDKSIYKKSQQFRTLGCTKIRKIRALKIYNLPFTA